MGSHVAFCIRVDKEEAGPRGISAHAAGLKEEYEAHQALCGSTLLYSYYSEVTTFKHVRMSVPPP